ncbi:uncharacterized protein METZ01_LOCUS346153 [marine metagenome]|uniref:Uncharacterized protein n=1 Tax=marine metagenome TaxID=408172 RepID=A0A382R6F3_9ZZZZ
MHKKVQADLGWQYFSVDHPAAAIAKSAYLVGANLL